MAVEKEKEEFDRKKLFGSPSVNRFRKSRGDKRSLQQGRKRIWVGCFWLFWVPRDSAIGLKKGDKTAVRKKEEKNLKLIVLNYSRTVHMSRDSVVGLD
jgi:hypothetical protein